MIFFPCYFICIKRVQGLAGIMQNEIRNIYNVVDWTLTYGS